MIFGEYPCCNGALTLHTIASTVYERETCPHCSETVWHKLSKFDPTSWTEKDFLALFEIDETTKQVKEKESMQCLK